MTKYVPSRQIEKNVGSLAEARELLAKGLRALPPGVPVKPSPWEEEDKNATANG